MAQDKRKVKILSANYDEALDILEWQIIDIATGKSLTLAWRAKDIPAALGMNLKDEQKIPSKALHDFCYKMTGQIRDFVFQKDDGFISPKDITLDNEEETMKSIENLDNYPFLEIEKKLRAQNDFKPVNKDISNYLFPKHLLKLMKEQEMNNQKARVFCSKDCPHCLKALVLLERSQIEIEHIDTEDDDEDIQKMCDYYNVDELPHIQLLSDSGSIIMEHIGPLDADDLINYLSRIG